ncbi:MAG TPA: hypothetical protein VID70_07130 [Solirubrobacteraceae bacterium]|jgi:hypothetical protein
MSNEPTDTETQRSIAAAVRSIAVNATPALHESVRQMVADADRGKRAGVGSGRRVGIALPHLSPLLVGALASAAGLVAVLILALGSNGPSAPTVLQASLLGLRPVSTVAPEENPRAPGQLAISTEGIAYPYWNRRFGWQTAGARSDTLGGRRVTTVFYANASGQRIGYSIVAGKALQLPNSGHAAVWHGTRFDVLHPGAFTVVTWRRDGHTCILVGSRVSAKTLLTLADWQTA